jgi:hypothetical protein
MGQYPDEDHEKGQNGLCWDVYQLNWLVVEPYPSEKYESQLE